MTEDFDEEEPIGNYIQGSASISGRIRNLLTRSTENGTVASKDHKNNGTESNTSAADGTEMEKARKDNEDVQYDNGNYTGDDGPNGVSTVMDSSVRR